MAKAAKSKKILSPVMLTLGAMTAWAAVHEPEVMSPASIGVWICGAFTVALLTRAGLALCSPLIGMMATIFGRALNTMHRDGAES